MRLRVIQPDKLRDLMARRGHTPRTLAEASGVSQSHVHYVLAGNFQLSDRAAADVARALRVRPTAFSRPKTPSERAAETERRRNAARRNAATESEPAA